MLIGQLVITTLNVPIDSAAKAAWRSNEASSWPVFSATWDTYSRPGEKSPACGVHADLVTLFDKGTSLQHAV